MARRGPVTAAGLAVLVALAAGVAGGAWLTEPPVPEVVADAEDLGVVPVTARSYDDARTVGLTVTAEPARELTSPVAGRISASSCTVGAEVASGQVVAAVDGAGLLALATRVPPWRDLTVGDSGADVAALNAELVRLGQHAPDSDRVTRATIGAYREAARAVGAAEPTASVVPAAAILWLPDATVRVGGCPAELGATVAVGDPLLVLATSPRARVSALPADGLPGERVLLLGDLTVPVDAEGWVTDPAALDAVLGSAAYTEASEDEDGTRQLSARWALREPGTVGVVTPAAVAGGGDRSCVVDPDGVPHPVRVVGSELGQTFVTADDELPDRVQAAPTATACG